MRKTCILFVVGILGCGETLPTTPEVSVSTTTITAFEGYKVSAHARAQGTTYWQNTTLPLDIILRVFLTGHRHHNPTNLQYHSQYSGWAGAVTAGDFNADGYMDVFTAGSACNGWQSRPTFLIWNKATLRFEEQNLFRQDTTYLGGPMGIEAVYLNEDNKVDLVIHGHSDECANINDGYTVTLALSAPDGKYDLTPLILEPTYVGQIGGEKGDVKDVTGDGLSDLYITNGTHAYIFRGIAHYPYFTNENTIHFANDTLHYPLAHNGFGERVPLAGDFAYGGKFLDVNADGRLDMVMQTTEDSISNRQTRIFYNMGNGEFSAAQMTRLPYYTSPLIAHIMDITLMDVSGDGRNDLVAVNQESYQYWNLVVYVRQPDNSYVLSPTSVVYLRPHNNRIKTKTALNVADFNNDGVLDIGYTSFGMSSCDVANKTVFIRKGNLLVETSLAAVDPYAKYLDSLVVRSDSCP